MNPKKDFKIASIVLLFLGVMDVITIGIEWFGANSLLFEGNIFVLVFFAVISIIALAKLYMGIMGLKYCKGTGKGKLHITLAKIGVILTAIAIVVSVIDMISGTGTVLTVLNDALDAYIIYWYFNLAKKNYA